MTPKRLVFLTLTLAGSMAACNEKPDAKTGKIGVTKEEAKLVTSVSGSWTGLFAPDAEELYYDKDLHDSFPAVANKITLFITKLKDGNISGYSICAGNERAFAGSYEEADGKIKAILQEPGDNKYDGVFELVIASAEHKLTGKWTPFDKKRGARHYTLERKDFQYNASLGSYPEASTRLLTTEDVNNLYQQDLRYMRNEIYARHGYSFKLKETRQMFDNKDWYMPVATDVQKKLSAIEVKNEKLIKNFEKYAEESYDDFGR